MKTILDAIIEHKKMEVMKRKGKKPLSMLSQMPLYLRQPLDPLSRFSGEQPAIIAEFKRMSPSKGIISEHSDPVQVVSAYKKAGAVAASILTDRDYFGGSYKDLENVRKAMHDFPLLRKDFIIDAYQLHEAKAYGADIILLIAAVLSKEETVSLSEQAGALGLSVLLEVHNEQELDRWNPAVRMIGVNNRDLKTFDVNLGTSLELVDKLPSGSIKVTESGLQDASDVKMLFEKGFRGFLMGEHFMKMPDPGLACKSFITELKEGL